MQACTIPLSAQARNRNLGNSVTTVTNLPEMRP